MLKFLLATLAALCALLVLFSGQVAPVPLATAHTPLCPQSTPSGYTTHSCAVLINGKYYTAWIPWTGLDYPNDAYVQNPTCNCIPLIPSGQLCTPASRPPHDLDACYTGSTGATSCRLYCGTTAGAHLHTHP